MIVPEDTLKLLLGLSSSITDEEQSFLTLVHPQAEAVVKDWLKYDPEQDDRTEYLPRHDRAGGAGYGGASVWESTLTHAYPVSTNGQLTLQVTHIPIRSVANVYVDRSALHGDYATAFADDTEITEGTDFWTDWDQEDYCFSGNLKSYGNWPSTPGTVKVIYRAGYSSTEFAGTASASSVVGSTITTKGISGAGIAMAVQSTVVAMFTRAMSMRKKALAGFTAGPLLSERLQDYSYTVDRQALSSGGLSVSLPDDARQMLEPYMHYGTWRL